MFYGLGYESKRTHKDMAEQSIESPVMKLRATMPEPLRAGKEV
jgi:hypothetical protein